ncbi:MAG: CocE/NonD family hydrolase [Candidatus Acidiferrales bacterium]
MIRKRVCIRAILGFLSVASLTARAEHKNASPEKMQSAAAQSTQSAAQTAPRGQRAYAMKIDFDRRVKMRDGVELSADVYRPDAPGQFPVILDRTPYVKASGGTRRVDRMRKYVEQGYVFVVMDVRGRGDSDGHFIPYRADGEDGYDAIEWCAAQPWSSGKVGTYGGSYEGMNQWLAAVQQPPHLTTMIALVSPSDQFVEDPTGIPIPQDISWYFFTSGHVLQNDDAVDWSKVYEHLPYLTLDEAAGRPSQNWKDLFDHPTLDAWWEPLRYQNKFDRVQVPVLHISGWYDDEQIGTPLNYIGMTTKGATEAIRKNQKLLMGPWPHAVNSTSKLGDVDFGPTAVIDLDGYMLRWYDHWLKGIDNGVMSEPPVAIFVMGTNQWVNENEWPIARTKWTNYYIHSGGHANTLSGDGALTTTEPAAEATEPTDGYRYDPANPTPFITAPSFAQIGGPDDYRSVEARNDVLVYSTEPMTRETEICGPIRAEIYAASSAKDTDFMLKLIDVWPDGYAERLDDGMVRARYRDGMTSASLIEPGTIYRYNIDAWNTCEMFKIGHRIRVEIASSGVPKYDRNPNTGDPLGRTTTMQPADQKIYHDREHPSHVILPVIPAKP